MESVAAILYNSEYDAWHSTVRARHIHARADDKFKGVPCPGNRTELICGCNRADESGRVEEGLLVCRSWAASALCCWATVKGTPWWSVAIAAFVEYSPGLSRGPISEEASLSWVRPSTVWSPFESSGLILMSWDPESKAVSEFWPGGDWDPSLPAWPSLWVSFWLTTRARMASKCEWDWLGDCRGGLPECSLFMRPSDMLSFPERERDSACWRSERGSNCPGVSDLWWSLLLCWGAGAAILLSGTFSRTASSKLAKRWGLDFCTLSMFWPVSAEQTLSIWCRMGKDTWDCKLHTLGALTCSRSESQQQHSAAQMTHWNEQLIQSPHPNLKRSRQDWHWHDSYSLFAASFFHCMYAIYSQHLDHASFVKPIL